MNQNNRSSNNTQQNNNQQQRQAPQLDAATQQRQNSIYADIMAGNFNIQSYTNQVPNGACNYHGNTHPGGTAACTAIRRIITKAAGHGVTNIPLESQLGTASNTPTNNISPPPMTSVPPQANHTYIHQPPSYYSHPYNPYQHT